VREKYRTTWRDSWKFNLRACEWCNQLDGRHLVRNKSLTLIRYCCSIVEFEQLSIGAVGMSLYTSTRAWAIWLRLRLLYISTNPNTALSFTLLSVLCFAVFISINSTVLVHRLISYTKMIHYYLQRSVDMATRCSNYSALITERAHSLITWWAGLEWCEMCS